MKMGSQGSQGSRSGTVWPGLGRGEDGVTGVTGVTLRNRVARAGKG